MSLRVGAWERACRPDGRRSRVVQDFKTQGGGGPPPSTQNKSTHEAAGSQRRPYLDAVRFSPRALRTQAKRALNTIPLLNWCPIHTKRSALPEHRKGAAHGERCPTPATRSFLQRNRGGTFIRRRRPAALQIKGFRASQSLSICAICGQARPAIYSSTHIH